MWTFFVKSLVLKKNNKVLCGGSLSGPARTNQTPGLWEDAHFCDITNVRLSYSFSQVSHFWHKVLWGKAGLGNNTHCGTFKRHCGCFFLVSLIMERSNEAACHCRSVHAHCFSESAFLVRAATVRQHRTSCANLQIHPTAQPSDSPLKALASDCSFAHFSSVPLWRLWCTQGLREH